MSNYNILKRADVSPPTKVGTTVATQADPTLSASSENTLGTGLPLWANALHKVCPKIPINIILIIVLMVGGVGGYLVLKNLHLQNTKLAIEIKILQKDEEPKKQILVPQHSQEIKSYIRSQIVALNKEKNTAIKKGGVFTF